MSVKKGELIHVIWHDAETINEWTDEDSSTFTDHSSTVCETVGYLVKNATKKEPFYIVASTKSVEDGKLSYNAIIKIPKGFVKELVKLDA